MFNRSQTTELYGCQDLFSVISYTNNILSSFFSPPSPLAHFLFLSLKLSPFLLLPSVSLHYPWVCWFSWCEVFLLVQKSLGYLGIVFRKGVGFIHLSMFHYLHSYQIQAHCALENNIHFSLHILKRKIKLRWEKATHKGDKMLIDQISE